MTMVPMVPGIAGTQSLCQKLPDDAIDNLGRSMNRDGVTRRLSDKIKLKNGLRNLTMTWRNLTFCKHTNFVHLR